MTPVTAEISKSRARVDSIQQLRALAAISVVLVHVGSELCERLQGGSLPLIPHDFVIGVDVFFAISGFIMYMTSASLPAGATSLISFCRKRFIRIVPTYWFYTTLMLLASWLAARRMTNPGIDLVHVLGSYAFVPIKHPAVDTLQPILRVGWTLNYEVFFYLLFAVSLLLERPLRMPFLFASIFALSAFGVIADPVGLIGFYTNSVILSFMFGLAIGKLHELGMLKGIRLSVLLAASAIAALFLLSPFRSLSSGDFGVRGITLGVPAALLLASVSCVGRIKVPLFPKLGAALTTLGDSSYSLYLSHMFAIGIFKIAFFPSSLVSALIAVPLCVLFCIICGHVAYLVAEKRLVFFSSRLIPAYSVP